MVVASGTGSSRPKVEKAHEGQAVADQKLCLLVGQIVQALQHKDLEFKDCVVGLATGVAPFLLGLRLRRGLDVSAEVLPAHRPLDRLQRIAFGAQRLQPLFEIKKARMPHPSPALATSCPMRHRVRFVSARLGQFFEVPLYQKLRSILGRE
jgi:hypothetical protein